MFYKRGVVQNVEKNYGKTHAPESNFNKVMLATLLKRDYVTRVFYDFFLLLNAGNWKNPHDCYLKITFFSSLRFLVLNYRSSQGIQ